MRFIETLSFALKYGCKKFFFQKLRFRTSFRVLY